MADQAQANICEHYYHSVHQAGSIIYWVRICQRCGGFDTEDLNREVMRFMEDAVAGMYHPEFGSEWREDGELFQLIKAAKAVAWDEGYRASQFNSTRLADRRPDLKRGNPYA